MIVQSLGAAGLAMFLVACASLPARTVRDAAAARGRDYAVANCAGCHAVGLQGVSPSPAAPPFRALRLDWTPLALRLRLERSPIHAGPDMRPRFMTQSELEDVTAYIRVTRAGVAAGPAVEPFPRCFPSFWC